MDLDRAVEVFVRASCLTKSSTYPYEPERRSGLWVMRDTPDRKNPRAVEIVSCDMEPTEAVEAARRECPGKHFLCDIRPSNDDFDAVRAVYKCLGYRALTTEWLFTRDLENVPVHRCDPPVLQVHTKQDMAAIPQRASQPRKLLAGTRQFAVWDADRDYGWVRSIPIGEDAWVSDLFVHSDVRRRGYGRALMSALLRSDAEHGVRLSVLLASKLGATLYPSLGYAQIATLQMFCPAA